MKHLIRTFILTLTSISIYAQCPDCDKLKFGGWLGIDSYDPATAEIQYFSYDVDTVNYCCHINRIKKYADFILAKSDNYIKHRAGTAFYSKLVFHDIMVIYHDYGTLTNLDYFPYELDKCGRVTYWLTYSYFQDSTIEYGFGVEFDSNGKKISESLIPNSTVNPNFMNIIGLCSAIDIVKKQNIVHFNAIKTIELNYDNKINSLIWLVKEDYPDTEGLHEQDVLYINANTGKLYKTGKVMIGIQY